MTVLRQKLIKKLQQEKEKAEKGNVTFRLTKALSDDFKKQCETDGFSAGVILEELMADYLDQAKKEL